MPFQFQSLEIPEIMLVKPRVFQDERGFLMETYKYSDLASIGMTHPVVQENHSYSSRGVLRGLHYQKFPSAQGKLVRVVAGEVFDVGVDLRRDAPTYGRWAGAVLSADNRTMLYLPPWCAHGFCVLSDEAHVVYMATAEYAPEHERGVIWNDPDLAIAWPECEPILSAKDGTWPRLRDADNDFTVSV